MLRACSPSDAQLLVGRGRICGLLDVDTAGLGDKRDDLACLLGHLSVLAQIDRNRAPIINRAGAAYLRAFEAVPPRPGCATGWRQSCCRWPPGRTVCKSAPGPPPPAVAWTWPRTGWPAPRGGQGPR